MNELFTPMPYQDWLAANPEVAAEAKKALEPCLECAGTGYHICDCGHKHPCGYCDGRGKVGTTPHDLYEAQKKRDLELLRKAGVNPRPEKSLTAPLSVPTPEN